MKWSFVVVALLCSVGQVRAAGQVEVIVNHVGSVPKAGVSEVDFKFAIIAEDGQQATAVAAVTGGAVTGFTVTDQGGSYAKPPKISIDGGGGKGCVATAVLSAGKVTLINLVAGGSGYTSPPYVTIAAPSSKAVVTTLWSNDLTSVNGSEPQTAVTLQVVDKTYSALLGYTGLPHMAALPRTVLANLDARVRVWTRKGKIFTRVIPDQPLRTVPYAEEAGYAELAGAVSPGAITASMLSPGAITADKLAPGALNNALPGALLSSLSPNDPQLGALGYSKVQTFAGHDWVPSVDVTAPSPRRRHTAVWTGTSMIVWGGEVGGGQLSYQGGEYAPDPKTWSPLSIANVPEARADHTAVWTGTNMVVWGGVTSTEPGGTATGGIFNGSSKSWRATSSASAPSARTQHTALWCGNRMIVWGGTNPNGLRDDGGVYVPPLDTDSIGTGAWLALPASAVASVRRGHSAIWTGSQMIIWGGFDGNGDLLNTGAMLDPLSGTWTALALSQAPTARFGHTALWTGSKMIVFGGADSETDNTTGHVLNDGAIFDPAMNAWTPLPAPGAPEVRERHRAVWTGAEMLVFGGEGIGGALLLTAGAFNPATNTWRSLPSAPTGATRLAGVWSGQTLLTFGLGGLEILDPSPTVYLYGRF